MCGIAGIVRFDDQPVHSDQVRALRDALSHRGPDGRDIWTGRTGNCHAGLAHTRLAVIDLSPHASQPMATTDGRYRIVFNGEIYNYRQLRDELQAAGATFRTHSDTEVVLEAWRRWDTNCFQRFNGMWAIAILDTHTGQGVLARDRFGIKPLYILSDSRRLVFASEMAALLQLPDWPRKIDPAGLNHYLRLGFVPHPGTIFADVRKLPPGHVLRFDNHGPSPCEPCYRLAPDRSGHSYEDARSELRHRLGTAVAARTVADVDVGAFLSGGIDSSIIVAHLAQTSHTVRTYTIGWADHARFDETRYARAVAQRYGTDHHEFKVTSDEVLAALPQMLDHVGEPFGDSSLIPTALISRYTRRHVKVALSGDGGDELFAGYWRHKGLAYLARYRKLPKWLRSALVERGINQFRAGKHSWLANRIRQAQKLLRASTDDDVTNYLQFATLLPDALERVFLEEGRREMAEAAVVASYRACTGQDEVPDGGLGRILAADLRYALPNDMLCKVDLASMACGLEVRVPMLDPAVVEYAMGLPPEFKLSGGVGKRVLIDAHRDMLPDAVIRRPKMGFEVPIGEFLRSELRDLFMDTVSAETVAAIGWLDHAEVLRIYHEHCDRRADHADLLYSLMSLCWWWRRWVAG